MESSAQALALRSLLALEVIGSIPICVARRAIVAMAVSKTAASIAVVLSAVKEHGLSHVATCHETSRERDDQAFTPVSAKEDRAT